MARLTLLLVVLCLASTALSYVHHMPISTKSVRSLRSFSASSSSPVLSTRFPTLSATPPTANSSSSTASSSSSSPSSSSPAIAVNPLISGIKISKTVEVFSTVKDMESKGHKVTSLCVGEPDFPPPSAVLSALASAIASNDTKYTAVSGTASLRAAIAKDLKVRKGVDYSPSEILVSNGAKQSVFQAILAVAGKGDEVIVPAPYWPSYPEMVSLTGATPVIVDSSIDDEFLLCPTKLAAAITPSTKLLILCNPSNPTGAVHSPARLEALAAVLRQHPHVAVLSDEIYERLTYAPSTHVSFSSLPGMRGRTFTVNGFSKAYSMTGLRLGYVAGPKELVKACEVIQSQLTSCASSLSQAGGLAALRDVPESEMEANVSGMIVKRDYVLKRLKGIEGVKTFTPAGAFYVLPDVGAWMGGDDTKLCLELLTTKKLALVPGSSFGAPGTVRISYATSMVELEEAMNKLTEFLEENRVSK